ncbi:hypothetical protein P3T76_000556 [Phytophthora citrophthora]|uniref:Uncharacterized protein n=1 Tax=Phytophthora citrophthora TaxID=4793 RepID=A0AAD9H132_9STRA|nr:hypothetical protein P3T76_000556 [Phytophthora citrophthora]
MTSVWRRLQLRIAGTTPARRFQVRYKLIGMDHNQVGVVLIGCDWQEEADVGVAAVLSCFRSLKLDPQNANK